MAVVLQKRKKEYIIMENSNLNNKNENNKEEMKNVLHKMRK